VFFCFSSRFSFSGCSDSLYCPRFLFGAACTGYGLSCLDNHVYSIVLPGLGLTGSLPTEIGRFTQLAQLCDPNLIKIHRSIDLTVRFSET